MAAQAALGKKLLEEKKYEAAIVQFTLAIKESPTSPDFFVLRSTAYQRAGQYAQALADADQGVLNGQKRAKKEAITDAQFRRGCALFSLGRYADADFIFTLVKKRDDKHKMVDVWRNKTTMSMNKLDEADDKRNITVTETPDSNNSAASSEVTQSTSTLVLDSAPSQPRAPQQTPPDKVRHEWYQNSENIYFTLLAAGVSKEQCKVETTESSLGISFPYEGTNSTYDIHFEPLFASIKPNATITRILPRKVEVILIKSQRGQKWSTLESKEPLAPKVHSVDSSVDTKSDSTKAPDHIAVREQCSTGPAYPTSSKSGPKDWDKVARELKTGTGDDKSGTLDDDDDEYEGGDQANAFFKKLYKGASPDVQRAMMKSFSESNGTSLSTNWEEVSKGRVETVPPDGMEAKKYDGK